MTTSARDNRVATVGPRQEELVAEARAMLDGKIAATRANILHVTALALALEEAQKDLAVATSLNAAQDEDIQSLQADLRRERGLLGYEESMPHVDVLFDEKGYQVRRTFVKAYGRSDYARCIADLKALRAQHAAEATTTEQPVSQGA